MSAEAKTRVRTPPAAKSPVLVTGRSEAGFFRRYDIDWLRVLAVLLLFPFHVSRVFNADDPFYVKADSLSAALSYALGFISVWHMQLLFVLAGASTYFALGKRSSRQYLWERVKRLALPFVFGVFVLIPPQTWYGGRFNSGYTESFWHYITSGDFLQWNIKDGGDYYGGFGIGHLWFIFVLLLIAVIVLPLLAWSRGERGAAFMRSFSRRLARPVWWPLAVLLVTVCDALPDVGGVGTFYYLGFFVLGYVVVCDGEFVRTAERLRWRALALGSALALWWVFSTGLRDSLPDPSLPRAGLTFLGILGTWLVIVGLLGCGKRYLDRTSPMLRYLAEASYPVYILHQTVIVVLAFYIVGLPASQPLQWLTLLVVSVVTTYALYEMVRRFSVSRVLFGVRALKKRRGVEGGAASTGRRLVLILAVLLGIVFIPVLYAQLTPPEPVSRPPIDLGRMAYDEVRFKSQPTGLGLAGMLFIPDGEPPFPTVVIIQGSGDTDRKNPWYLNYASYLLESGIAVFLPDKRGCGASGGDWRGSSLEDLATDAAAAVSCLRTERPELVQRIGILGVSQGAYVAPVVAGTSDLSFVVSIVGGGVPMHDVLLYEENNNFREMGFLPGVSNALSYASTAYLRRVSQREFWSAVGNFDPLPYWREVDAPTLVVLGSDDTLVPSTRTQENLDALGRANVRVVVFEGSGHGLEPPEGVAGDYQREDALELIRDFILKAGAAA